MATVLYYRTERQLGRVVFPWPRSGVNLDPKYVPVDFSRPLPVFFQILVRTSAKSSRRELAWVDPYTYPFRNNSYSRELPPFSPPNLVLDFPQNCCMKPFHADFAGPDRDVKV
jgi:hypothetical protein